MFLLAEDKAMLARYSSSMSNEDIATLKGLLNEKNQSLIDIVFKRNDKENCEMVAYRQEASLKALSLNDIKVAEYLEMLEDLKKVQLEAAAACGCLSEAWGKHNEILKAIDRVTGP